MHYVEKRTCCFKRSMWTNYEITPNHVSISNRFLNKKIRDVLRSSDNKFTFKTIYEPFFPNFLINSQNQFPDRVYKNKRRCNEMFAIKKLRHDGGSKSNPQRRTTKKASP